MIEKGPAGRCQVDASHAAGKEQNADFMLEVAHLAAQGRLCRM
ncbi:MAG TPA: hypothetical protein VGL12_01690 [Roseiarcus sp.]|jgi:hypothetical protein